MKKIKTSNKFLRDMKLARKRGKDLNKMYAVIERLGSGEKLEPRFRVHRLKGEMNGPWECHVESDWHLIWDEDDENLFLTRCGTHADLFE
jgi:mRNA interferase YafQ